MPDPITFAAAHARTAVGNPDAPAIVLPDQQLGHDQIRRLGLAFAARMQAAGVGPGSRVQLRTPDPVLVLAVLLGVRLSLRRVTVGDVAVGQRHQPERGKGHGGKDKDADLGKAQ